MASAQPQVGVVDYGSGNLRSVAKALETSGAAVRVLASTEGWDALDALVVPGVGSFGDCAAHLDSAGMRQPILDWIAAGRSYLGICLGYQLLFESSEESPGVSGLGVLPGSVVRFPRTVGKIPHMGWNTLADLKGPLFDGAEPLEPGASMYFVHSFYPCPASPEAVSSICHYGVPFAASVSLGRLHATQFHPEKSQAVGLRLLRNFLHTL